MSDSYLVKGAKIKCTCGSMPGELKVKNNNVCLLKVPVATVNDCKVGENIPSFGICSHTGKPCLPMILGKWLCPHEKTVINGAKAITTDSALVCGMGGIILSETSGQETIMKMLAQAADILKNLFGLGNSPCSSDPVNLITGNYVLQTEDIHIMGSQPLSFTRTYNSLSTEKSVCGNGWEHNHQIYLIDHKETIEIHIGNGGQVRTFRKDEAGDYETTEFAGESLSLSLNGYQYRDRAKRTFLFAKDGLCREIKHEDGNTTVYTYTGHLLAKVQNLSGYLSFFYNGREKLSSVEDQAGRTVTFEYDKDNLVKAGNLSGGCRQYAYDEKNRLIEEITPYGVKKVLNEFDRYGRAVKQTLPDGGTLEYQYDDDRTVYITQNKNKYRFYRDKWQRDCRITSHDGQIEKRYNHKNQITEMKDCNGNRSFIKYDQEGNVILTQDAAGNKTKTEYNRSNYPVKLIYQDGSYITTDYNELGQIIQNTDQLGRKSKYSYHARGIINKIINPDESEVRIQIDDKGNITEVVNPFNSKTRYEYDILNRVTATIDGNGNKTLYTYNQNNDVTSVTDALGFTKEYKYNYNGKITEITDQNGCQTHWEYNSMNCPIKKIDEQGRETLRDYDLMWNVRQQTEANGAVTKYVYNKSNRLEKVIAPEGGETSYLYDGNGNCTKITMPDDFSVVYHYDRLNQVIQIDYPNGASEHFEYDFAGNMTRITDPNGGEYCMEYDGAGQKIKQTDPAGTITRFEYNNLGQITKIREPLNRITEYCYYPGGILKSKKFPDGSELFYSYDSAGNLISKQDQTGYRVELSYDALNRIASICNSRGQSKAFTYDGVGNLLTITDSKGAVTEYEYTKTGALKAVVDPVGVKTIYEHDETDRILSVKQMAGLKDEFEEATSLNKEKVRLLALYIRDLEGKVIYSKDAAGNVQKYQRDSMGNIRTLIDSDGMETHYTFDSLGNISTVDYPDGKSVLLEYDALNQLIQLKDWLGSVTIQRAPSGLPERITDHKDNTFKYEWNPYGKRTRTTYPDGKTIAYEYDDNGQKLQGISWDEQQIRYQYDENSLLSGRTCGSHQESRYSHDPLGQLKHLSHSCPHELFMEKFEYNNEGLPIHRYRSTNEADENLQYYYDKLNRLTEVRDGFQSLRKYEYDSFGNRILKRDQGIDTRYYYNELNQLVSEETENKILRYEYDKRGNVSRRYKNDELLETYTYNVRNKLDKVLKQDGTEISYAYDGFGNRTEKRKRSKEAEFGHGTKDATQSSVEFITDYARGDHNLIGEKRNGTVQNYIWEPQSHHLVGLIKGNDCYFYQNDFDGSPVRLLSHEGRVESKYLYDEFGRPDKKISGKSAFGYTGYYYDNETELYYAGKRYYNSNAGLFYGIDIIKGNTYQPMSLHPYMYCLNNPLVFFDPDGASPEHITGEDGTEAHVLLERYFMANYKGTEYTPTVEKIIPGGNPASKTGDGRYDMLLELKKDKTVELYELKPISHSKITSDEHLKDDERFNNYKKGVQKMYPNYVVKFGTTFDPHGLFIPSERYKDYYVEYYAYYGAKYNSRSNPSDARDSRQDGYIYWKYQKKDPRKDKTRWIWGINANSDSNFGSNDKTKNNVIEIPDEVKSVAMTGGVIAVIGGVLYEICKDALILFAVCP